jgi:hypothetical protein
VCEGGEVLDIVSLDRGAFARTLSRGDDPRLFVVGEHCGESQPAPPSGQVVAVRPPHPGAGRP